MLQMWPIRAAWPRRRNSQPYESGTNRHLLCRESFLEWKIERKRDEWKSNNNMTRYGSKSKTIFSIFYQKFDASESYKIKSNKRALSIIVIIYCKVYFRIIYFDSLFTRAKFILQIMFAMAIVISTNHFTRCGYYWVITLIEMMAMTT